MTLREFKENLGLPSSMKPRAAFNAAIRQKCPGGDLVLDALETWSKILNRQYPGGWTSGDDTLEALAFRQLEQIREEMLQSIFEEYGFDEKS